MVIQHNMPAFRALNSQQKSNTRLSKKLEKLSSGYRVGVAADDAAGLAISEKMRAKIRGMSQANENAAHGIAVVQTAEGALAECHAVLQRMGELSVQSLNGVYREEDRLLLDDEYQHLQAELDRIAESTHFNGIRLLDGSLERRPRANVPRANVPRANMPAAPPAAGASLSEPVAGLAAASSVSPAAASSISGVNAQITADGVYEIAAGFTGTISIAAGLHVTLTQAGGAALHEISVQCGAGADLTLKDLNIENSTDLNAVNFTGAGNRLHVEGNNRIISTATAQYNPVTDDFDEVEAAILHAGAGTELMIDGSGSLRAETAGLRSTGGTSSTCGQLCAVIGGNNAESGGSITINGGAITAISRVGGAAIGGGFDGDGGNITINGGNVTAESSTISSSGDDCYSAAIGGGGSGNAGNIIINGGTVNASSSGFDNSLGAAIGSGAGSSGGSVLITNGTVHAVTEHGGAAIGAGGSATGCFVKITGGTITAESTGNSPVPTGAAIGSGANGSCSEVLITGGTIHASSRGTGAAIGGGAGSGGGVINLSGGNITASTTAGAFGAAIGGGQYGDGGAIHISGAAVEASAADGAFGAAIGGGSGCYRQGGGTAGNIDDPGRPGSGANLTMDGGSQVTISKGWIGGGLDEDSCDFGLNGSTKLCTDSTLVNNPAFVLPTVPPSHFTAPPSDPTVPPVIFDPADPAPPDENIYKPREEGGLILQIGSENAEHNRLHVYIENMSARSLTVGGTHIRTAAGALTALNRVQFATARVSTTRGALGAYRNRLEHTMNSLGSAGGNLTAAESRIRDADMAREMVAFTRESILSQCAQSMLAQANHAPGQVLSLLRQA